MNTRRIYSTLGIGLLLVAMMAMIATAVPVANAKTDEGCCNCWVTVTGGGTDIGSGWYTNCWVYAERGCYWPTQFDGDLMGNIFFGVPIPTSPLSPEPFHSGYVVGPFKSGDVSIYAWSWFKCPSGYTYADDSWSL